MATPTFNKYKSTTIFGNLSVRDLTNSSGSTVIEVASIDLSGNFLSRGDSTFTKAVVCNALLADINANNKLTTKEYVDNSVSGGSILGLNNTFTGTNIFNNTVDVSGNFNIINSTELQHSFSIKDTSNVVKINISQIGINQTDPIGENTYNGTSFFQNTLSQEDIVLPSNKTNTFINSYFNEGIDISGNSTFNVKFPTSTLASGTAVTNDSIPNKGKNDTLYSSITNEVKSNTANAFTSTNSFNSFFPTSTLASGTAVTDDSIMNKANLDSLYANLNNNVSFLGEITFDGTTNTINGTTTNLYGTTTNITGTTNISGDTSFSGTNNSFTSIEVSNLADPAPLTLQNGAFITQSGTAVNTLNNLTLDGGILTQLNNTTTNTMVNLKVKTIATEPIIATQVTETYSSVKMRNYVFHSRTTTAASGITLSTDANIDDGQYLYVRKIGSGVYTLTLTRGGTTTFLNLSNASVTTIAITGLTGVSFVYNKPNTRWIQLT